MSNTRFQGDIAVKITKNGAKMKFIDGEPVRDRGIENPIQISLYTKLGWWGNDLIKDVNKKIGSKHERPRVVIDIDTLNEIRDDAKIALQWMFDTNLISNYDLELSNPNANYILEEFKFYPPGQDVKELLFFNNGINWINQSIDPANEKMKDVE